MTEKINSFDALNNTLLDLALVEDLGFPYRDATTDVLFSDDSKICSANIISKHPESIVVCGIGWVSEILRRFSDRYEISLNCSDGDELKSGEVLLTIQDSASTLLKTERVILNFLRHLSAISTLTAKYVSSVKNTPLKILDTRKTTPGFRQLEKYAVVCGGGVNHRMGLYDAIMIKDTHIDLAGGMEKILNFLPEITNQTLPVIVEVDSAQQLDIVLAKGRNKIQRVLLDNMSPKLMSDCVKICSGIFETEASGNISLDTILAVAETGVDYASIGELTYGAGNVDLSMKIVHN